MTDAEENFIPFIHNYCDRWCERCEFTDRCRVFAMEAEMAEEEKDIESGAFVRSITDILEDAKKMLAQKAAEMGIDLDEAPDPEYMEMRKRKREMVRSDELSELATGYAMTARKILEPMRPALAERMADDPALDDMMEILYWYLFFISAKIQRGLNGIIDEDGDEDWDELNDPQSDANGSVKIALIAIERSILAWTYILPDDGSAEIRSMIDLLERIRSLTEQKFPIARDFIRPGFDELGMVM
jgi:hypothetical protein